MSTVGGAGMWRLVMAGPTAMVSTVQVTVVAQLLGPLWVLGVAGWAAAGLLLLRPAGERFAVRRGRFRPAVAGNEAGWLHWLAAAVERRCAVGPGELDWYVLDAAAPNALAAGRRSVAVSTGLLRAVATRALDQEQAIAIGVHEVGHHRTGGARYGLLTHWLCWPWQATYRGITRLCRGLPYAEAAPLLLPVLFVVAILNVAGQDAQSAQKVPVLVLLVGLAFSACVHPAADAAIIRAGEYAADAYAESRGLGPQLATALQQVDTCPYRLWERMRSSHPPTSARVRRLQTAATLR